VTWVGAEGTRIQIVLAHIPGPAPIAQAGETGTGSSSVDARTVAAAFLVLAAINIAARSVSAVWLKSGGARLHRAIDVVSIY
jgi:hypothetical protein